MAFALNLVLFFQEPDQVAALTMVVLKGASLIFVVGTQAFVDHATYCQLTALDRIAGPATQSMNGSFVHLRSTKAPFMADGRATLPGPWTSRP